MSKENKIWVVIPAAGVGKRMNSNIPKQYMMLNNQTVIEHTLAVFLQQPLVSGIVVAVSKDDGYWSSVQYASDEKIHVADGGKERCDSVLNALLEIKKIADEDDWVLVHDAARPCLAQDDLLSLINQLRTHTVGGLLAFPVRDTMKRQSMDGINVVDHTVEREGLWHALTPQMFKVGMLYDALTNALNAGAVVTDESSAMEYAGYSPVLIEGKASNIKVTQSEDLLLASFFLTRQKG